MQYNKNGIRVQTPRKHSDTRKKRKPLEIELDKATFYQTVEGQLVTIVVPYFSPLFPVLYEDGWRRAK